MKKLIATMATMASVSMAQTTTFRGELEVRSSWNNTKVDGSTVRESVSNFLNYENLGVGGTNAVNKGDMKKLIVRKGTFTNNVDATYNLASVANSFGDLVNFSAVKFLALYVYPTETNAVYQVGGGASDSFQSPFGVATGYAKVTAGGFYMMIAPNYSGYPVGTATNLYIKNISTGVCTNTPFVLYVGGI